MTVTVIDSFNFTTIKYENVLQFDTIFNDSYDDNGLQMDYSLIINIIYRDSEGIKTRKCYNPHSDMTFIVKD